MIVISPNTVFVTSPEVAEFASHWPCSGMRFDDDIAVSFQFASNGDLIDICWYNCTDNRDLDINEPAGINSEALLALSQDAQEFLFEGTQNGI